MILYYAHKPGAAFISEDGRKVGELEPRLDLANRSPTGFAWGYGGSGPHQFGLAILADHFSRTMKESQEPDARALRLYQRFTFRAIVPRNRDSTFDISAADVERIVAELEQEDAREEALKRAPAFCASGKTGITMPAKRGKP